MNKQLSKEKSPLSNKYQLSIILMQIFQFYLVLQVFMRTQNLDITSKNKFPLTPNNYNQKKMIKNNVTKWFKFHPHQLSPPPHNPYMKPIIRNQKKNKKNLKKKNNLGVATLMKVKTLSKFILMLSWNISMIKQNWLKNSSESVSNWSKKQCRKKRKKSPPSKISGNYSHKNHNLKNPNLNKCFE